MRFQGTIQSWNDDRGFGFIAPAQGGQEIFVHIKAFSRGTGRPQVNQRVTFALELGPQGKKRALAVEPLRSPRTAARARRNQAAAWGSATLFAIPAILVLCLAVSVLWRPPLWLAAAYLGASVPTFIVYRRDKAAARSGGSRTPESTLHALSLAGGWPGAIVAQQFLRHKSTKAEFRSAFWASVAVNVAGFVVFASPVGRSLWGAP